MKVSEYAGWSNIRMRIAVMQPYFFPYYGYIELANAVDKFVFLDDVTFIKKGWIHRNKIRDRKGVIEVKIPLSGASQNRLINNIQIFDYQQFQDSFFKIMQHCYGKIDGYRSVEDSLKLMIDQFSGETIADFNIHSLMWVFDVLNIQCEIYRSSEIRRKDDEKGQDKIINICKEFGADTYYNLPGGSNLYSDKIFLTNNIKLRFIDAKKKVYRQFHELDFIENLSILDFILFNKIPGMTVQRSMYKEV